MLQQDNALAHQANETVEFLSRNLLPITSHYCGCGCGHWPPNSSDLNSVDYEVWGVLQERVYRTRIRDVDHSEAAT